LAGASHANLQREGVEHHDGARPWFLDVALKRHRPQLFAMSNNWERGSRGWWAAVMGGKVTVVGDAEHHEHARR